MSSDEGAKSLDWYQTTDNEIDEIGTEAEHHNDADDLTVEDLMKSTIANFMKKIQEDIIPEIMTEYHQRALEIRNETQKKIMELEQQREAEMMEYGEEMRQLKEKLNMNIKKLEAHLETNAELDLKLGLTSNEAASTSQANIDSQSNYKLA